MGQEMMNFVGVIGCWLLAGFCLFLLISGIVENGISRELAMLAVLAGTLAWAGFKLRLMRQT